MEVQLPPGWKQFTDKKSGRPYYYDTIHKKTYWSLPSDVLSNQEYTTTDYSTSPYSQPRPHRTKKPLPQGWEERTDPSSGRIYYVNIELGKSTWELPTEPQPSEEETQPHSASPSRQLTFASTDGVTAIPKVNYSTPLPNTMTLLPSMEDKGLSSHTTTVVPIAVRPETYTMIVHSDCAPSSSASLYSQAHLGFNALDVFPEPLSRVVQMNATPIRTFASSRYCNHQTGVLFLKKSIPVDEIIAFQKDPINKALIRTIHKAENKQLDKEALKNFETILSYCQIRSISNASSYTIPNSAFKTAPGEKLSAEQALSRELVVEMLNRLQEYPELVDEVYNQLIKQTTPDRALKEALTNYSSSPSSASAPSSTLRQEMEAIERCWHILCFTCEAFVPSKEIEGALLLHLESFMKGKTHDTTLLKHLYALPMLVPPASLPETHDGTAYAEHLRRVYVYARACLNRLLTTTLYGGSGSGRKRGGKKNINYQACIVKGGSSSTSGTAGGAHTNAMGALMKLGQGQGLPPDYNTMTNSHYLETTELPFINRVSDCALGELMIRQHEIEFPFSPASSTSHFTSPQSSSEFTQFDMQIPIVAVYLCMNLFACDGLNTEGIFRKCRTPQETEKALADMNTKGFCVHSTEPHVWAVLLKTWLTRMTDPLIPFSLYNHAISNPADPVKCCEFVEREIPKENSMLLKYLCRFLRVVCIPAFVEQNKMHCDNLALIFAPTLIRMDTYNPVEAMTNLQNEIRFLFTLITSYFGTEEDEFHFQQCDEYVCRKANIQVDPDILRLLATAGR